MCITAEQAFGGKKSHLGVVGDSSKAAVSWRILSDALWAEVAKDFGPLHELHRRTECITDGTTQKATKKTSLYCSSLLPLATPKRCLREG